mgnify:CR=1 FL=1|jgi:hypothetical protein|tara:strand:- start:4228 stop:4599 length:372 start_codon:yes stop_codon:yes gene_type:complete
MGGFSSQVQQAQASQPTPSPGKGGFGDALQKAMLPKPSQDVPQPMPAVMPESGGGKGQSNYEKPTPYSPPDSIMSGKGSSTNSATSGQPRMGQPNNYANTIPQWDNASQQLAPAQRSGKGKGG